MLSLLTLLVSQATAGDQALYERALQLMADHYLHPEALSAQVMFTEAGDQLEDRVEWLLVEPSPGALSLRDGQGGWHAEVRLADDADLPAALSRLEDAVRSAGLPIDPEVDLRVEILRGLAHVLDRHSVVLHADGLERFEERLNGTLTGVGATISVDDAGLFIRELVPNGPAERAGLHTNDRLISVDGVSTVGMVPSDATDRIRGAAGTRVVLLVKRDGVEVSVGVQREEITIRNVTASRGPKDVAVVTIDHFSDQTRTYLLESLDELSKQGILANGLVIDLRGNTGGSLIQSAQAADTFLGSGVLVSTVGRDGGPVPSLVPRMEAHPDSPPWSMPIVVLMDHSTASGSEILAGALAKLDRAVLVGTNSFGKGTVQKVYQLDPAIKLKLTVAEYLLDGGTRVNEVGLQPDVALAGVRFTDRGVWYPSPARERRRLPEATPLVDHVSDVDAPLDIAAALLTDAGGATRADLLDAARRNRDMLAGEADARVVEAFRARGIDWVDGRVDGEPLVDVRWSFDASGGVVTATVSNHGPDLYRAALRLESVNPAWDDLVLPLGRLSRGEERTATARLELDEDRATRTDRVGVSLEAAGITPRPLPSRDFLSIGREPPVVGLTARASRPDTNGEVKLTVDVENRGPDLLNSVTARVAFPDAQGIELVVPVSAPVSVASHDTARLELRLKVWSTWTGDNYPLSLRISADGHPRIADWDVSVPRGGGVARLAAPTLLLEVPPTVLPPGTARLHVRASDDHALDHVVVFAGPESMNRSRATPVLDYDRDKVAWTPAKGRREDLDLALPVVAGTNHYVVVAEDRDGLRTVRDVYVYGDDGGAGVAGEISTPPAPPPPGPRP